MPRDDFPAVTVCEEVRHTGYSQYMQEMMGKEETMALSRELMHNTTEYGKKTMTAWEMSKIYALQWADEALNDCYETTLNDLSSPNVTQSMGMSAEMERMMFKNVNPRVLNLTSYSFDDVIKSCTFNHADDCWKSDRFLIQNGLFNCFTFNHLGNEKLRSLDAGLQLTLYKNASELRVSHLSTDSFRVVIHSPQTPPNVLR